MAKYYVKPFGATTFQVLRDSVGGTGGAVTDVICTTDSKEFADMVCNALKKAGPKW